MRHGSVRTLAAARYPEVRPHHEPDEPLHEKPAKARDLAGSRAPLTGQSMIEAIVAIRRRRLGVGEALRQVIDDVGGPIALTGTTVPAIR